jgi:hypothetical protein
MSIRSLFKARLVYEDKNLEDYIKLKARVSKFSLPKSTKETPQVYFACFSMQGQTIVLYEEEPKIDTVPSSIIDIKDITECKEMNLKEENVLYLKILNDKIGLKFEKLNQQKEWFDAIQALKNFYNKESRRSLLKEFKEELNPYTSALIQAEREQLTDKYKNKEKQFNSFFRDKKLNIFLESDNNLLKNRFCVMECKIVGKSSSSKLIDNLGFKKKNSLNFSKSSSSISKDEHLYDIPLHLLLVCQKPITSMNEETIFTDYKLIDEKVIPPTLLFNNLYFFIYDSAGDESAARKIIPVRYVY